MSSRLFPPNGELHADESEKTIWSCGICDRLRFDLEADRAALIALGVPHVCGWCNGWCLQ